MAVSIGMLDRAPYQAFREYSHGGHEPHVPKTSRAFPQRHNRNPFRPKENARLSPARIATPRTASMGISLHRRKPVSALVSFVNESEIGSRRNGCRR